MSYWNPQQPPALPPRSPRPPTAAPSDAPPGYTQTPYFPPPPTASGATGPPPIPPRPAEYRSDLAQASPRQQPASGPNYNALSPQYSAPPRPTLPPRPLSYVSSPGAAAPSGSYTPLQPQQRPNNVRPTPPPDLPLSQTASPIGNVPDVLINSYSHIPPPPGPPPTQSFDSVASPRTHSPPPVTSDEPDTVAKGIEKLLQTLEISTGTPTAPKLAVEDRAKVQSPSQKSATEHASPPRPPVKAPERIAGKKACINIPMTFPSTWYSHPDAPEISICSRCYEQHLQGTRFRRDFEGSFFDDHKARVCTFDTPRIKDHVLKEALKTGSLRELVDYMKFRATVPNCRGVDGAKGSEGIKWFIAKDNVLPGFVMCQACWEDQVLARPFSAKFEPASVEHAANDVWACDIAVPYISKQYAERSDSNDWASFVTETTDRFKVPACPKTAKVPLASRKWFCPIDTPSVLICAACVCDHVFGSGEEGKWRSSESDTSVTYTENVVCVNGLPSMTFAMSCAEYRKDYSIFWDALDAAINNQACVKEMQGATWYTLRSDPQDFGVCGGCYGALIKSLDLTQFFIPKTVPPDLEYSCCLNKGFPRYEHYIIKLLEAHYREDTTTLEEFSAVYTKIPICRRDKDYKNGLWYGWPDCTICPECHHEFIRGTALADSMPYQGLRSELSIMCKMYSPRMRNMYLEACAANPPDPSAMCAYSNQRTQVYVRTMMRIEQMMVQQRLALGEQMRLNAMSSFYTSSGNMQAASMGSTQTWGASGVGYGFQNQNQLQGAIYGRQATAAGSSIASGGFVVQIAELERQWREVE